MPSLTLGGTLRAMVMILENGISNLSSNPQ